MSDPGRSSEPAESRLPAVPLRGTQSFVTVMAGTWRRPGLTALEVLWRWTVGLPWLWFAVRAMLQAFRSHPLNTIALEAMTVFEPMAAVDTLERQLAPLIPQLASATRLLLPLGLAAWAVASTLGRLAIWRHLDPSLRGGGGTVAMLGVLRLFLLLAFVWMWVQGISAAARYSISSSVRSGAEPNLVLFSAMVVVLTLLVFLLWSLMVWPLDAAPLFVLAQRQGLVTSLSLALGAASLRSRLIEINLVMGIVKVGLLVLAMVFCATPLPFSAEETQGFLIGWWSFVGILFLVALDFFHVVRRAANLSFFRTLMAPMDDTSSVVQRAY